MTQIPRPLVVDLDGTLVKTDLLLEGLLQLFKKNFFDFLRAFLLLLQDIPKGKAFVAQRVFVDASKLPYRESILKLIQTNREQGVKVYLVSASHHSWVASVAQYLGCFDGHYGTSHTNLSGEKKLKFIQNTIGLRDFSYAADSIKDRVIWKEAAEAIVVNDLKWISILYACRPHQWVKNFLVFIPILAGHQIGNPNKFVLSLLAFAAMSLVASSVYIFNDLLDLDSDRAHPSRKKRMVATGDVSLMGAIALSFCLCLAGVLTSAALGIWCLGTVAIYLILNFFYSKGLKKVFLLDIVMLTSFYLLRIYLGSFASDQYVSYWLLAFSLLFFFSLATLKRYNDLSKYKQSHLVSGRAYAVNHIGQLFCLGATSSLLSVVVLSLYLYTPQVRELYQAPIFLWGLILSLSFWSFRIWKMAGREKMNDDPVVYSLTDSVSIILTALAFSSLALATFLKF